MKKLSLWLTHYPKGTQRVQHTLFIPEKYYIEIIISSKSGGWLTYSVYPTELQIVGLQDLMCDKIFFFFYFLQQILNKIDNYTPDMFPYTDEENDWISRT